MRVSRPWSGIAYHEISGEATDEAANFENGECREDLGGFCGELAKDFVDGSGVGGDMAENLRFDGVEGEFAGGMDGFGGGEVEGCWEWSECFEDIIDVADEQSAVADELIAAGAGEAVDRPGNSEDLAVLFLGVPRRVESAGASGSFDEEDAEGESADDAVALREKSGKDGLVERHFAEQGAAGCDVGGEGLMFGGVDGVKSAGKYGESAAGGVEGGAVGGGIDTAGKSADDGETRARKLGGEAFGLADAVHGTASGANDGDRQFVLRQKRTADIQDLRGIADFLEAFGITGLLREVECDDRIMAFRPVLCGLLKKVGGSECGGQLRTDAGYFAKFGDGLPENVRAAAEVFDEL